MTPITGGACADPSSATAILSTPRLELRRLQPADLDALCALYRDPEIRRYFPDGVRTRDETREELEWFLNGHPRHPELGLWATIERATGAFIGRCGLLPWHIDGRFEVELALLVDKARWGEGLGTEAARGIVAHAREHLHLRRLICLITPGNVASARVAAKAGMRFEREYTDEHGRCEIHAMTLAVELVTLEVRRASDLAPAVAAAVSRRADALLALSDPVLGNALPQLVKLTAANRLPAIYSRSEFADEGGLLAYGPNFATNYRRAATYVDRILKGAKPAELAIEQPTTFELVVNARTAKALGLTVPASLLQRADRVIE